jgi:hypothetical protein
MKKLQIMLFALTLLSFNAFSQKDTAQSKKAFVPSGKLWGYVFGDFTYKAHANSFSISNTQYASLPKDYNLFDIRRIYLGYDYDISEHFSTQLLLAYEGQTASDGSRTVFIKAANLRWKNIFKNSDLVMGQMSTPTFATTSESVWGYRSLEKTIMDERKIGGSNDVGVSLQGKLNDKGDYGYNLMISNGSGAKPETDKFKKLYADMYVKFMDQKFMLDLGIDNERSQLSPYMKSKTTYKAFLAYQTKPFTMGLEAFQQVQKNAIVVTGQLPSNDVASGISVFAKGLLTDKLSWVLRYDNYNPDTQFNENNAYASTYTGMFKETFLLAGLDFAPMKNVHIIPNIWYNSYNNRDVAVNHLSRSSYDLAARVTVYYVFK